MPALRLQDHLLETATLATHLSMHSTSKSSDLLPRPQGGAGPSRSSALLERLSSLSPSKSFSPRSPQALAGASTASLTAGGTGDSGPSSSGTATAATAATVVAGSAMGAHRAGLGLQHLTMGARSGTPRLGGSPSPTRDLVDTSMAYLSPDESSMVRSATTLAPAGSSAGRGSSSPGPNQAQASPLPAAPEMPLSWVPALSISRERLDSRCPRGHKAVQYRQARREVFAGIGECSRWDGLVSDPWLPAWQVAWLLAAGCWLLAAGCWLLAVLPLACVRLPACMAACILCLAQAHPPASLQHSSHTPLLPAG